jgi:hypothetical protein
LFFPAQFGFNFVFFLFIFFWHVIFVKCFVPTLRAFASAN